MKKLLYFILLFLDVPFTGFSQSDTTTMPNTNIVAPSTAEVQHPSLNNQMDFDVEVLAISLGYKFGISENWLVGFSLGIGPVASLGYIVDYHGSTPSRGDWFLTELLHLGIVAKTSNKTNKWSFEVEPRLGLAGWGDGIGILTFNFGGSIFYGGKVQIGVRTAIGKVYNTGNKFFLSNNLILRIPLKTN